MKKRKPVLIIAEAGVNHNGNIELAKKLIDCAVSASADLIKFQTFKADLLVTPSASLVGYQINKNLSENSQYNLLKKLELNYETHQILINYCKEKGISFFSTPFDLESVNMLANLGQVLFKIPSGEITNYPLLQHIGRLNCELILSTGMSNLLEIEKALSILEQSGTDRSKVSLLHCTTEYPAPIDEVNLNAMLTLKQKFGLRVGYSDHTIGFEVSFAAVAMGATIIEKHFTVDKNLPGPDHKASLDPKELKEFVSGIRNVESAFGDGLKHASESEKKNITLVRRSIVAKKIIKKGEIFTVLNMDVKRPENGISAVHWEKVLGKKAKKDFKKNDLITT